MNLEKERELFERYEHSKKPCANRNRLFEVFTKDGLDVDEYHYIGRYVCSFMQEKWELWQASASREGYKMVPVEPTDYMKCCVRDFDPDIWDYENMDKCGWENLCGDIYKAMLGAVE